MDTDRQARMIFALKVLSGRKGPADLTDRDRRDWNLPPADRCDAARWGTFLDQLEVFLVSAAAAVDDRACDLEERITELEAERDRREQYEQEQNELR